MKFFEGMSSSDGEFLLIWNSDVEEIISGFVHSELKTASIRRR